VAAVAAIASVGYKLFEKKQDNSPAQQTYKLFKKKQVRTPCPANWLMNMELAATRAKDCNQEAGN